MSGTISKELQSYLKTIESESRDAIIEGYFHVDYVIDAFKKGEKHGGQKALDNLRYKFTRASTQMFLYGIDLIQKLSESGFKTENFFVNPFSFKFLVVTALENTYSEDFIDLFFETATELEERFMQEFDIQAHYLFVQDEGLNSSEILADGFIQTTHG